MTSRAVSAAAFVLVLFASVTASTVSYGAGVGKPSLNAYFQSTLSDEAYQKKTFARVAAAWKTPPAKSFPKVGAKAVVQAVIAKDGKLASTTVSMSSGSQVWDAAALAAVQKAAPFDPLPASYKYPSLEVHFHVSVAS
jgi:periplasmic protein TonB